MWSDADAPVGCDAMWTKVDAMTAAGLLGQERGYGVAQDGFFMGHATKLWATDALMSLAADHGITADNGAASWTITEEAQRRRPVITGDPIVLRPWKVMRDGYWRDEMGGTLPIPARDLARAAEMRAGVERLNDRLGRAVIRGIAPPVFRRTFVGDLRLGGRFFTLGPGSFSNAARADRRAMTIGGERVGEVDIRASQLTAFLTLTDPARLEGREDLYDLEGQPREAVKAFLVQTFGTGQPIRQWGANTTAAVRASNVNAVRRAVLEAYPTLAVVTAILPDDLRSALLPEQRGRAAGQHLAALEATMLARAVAAMMDADVVALPLHDALVVPCFSLGTAADAIKAAFNSVFGVTPAVSART